MNEKTKTAYHEAGHCFRAWCVYYPAVRSVCLYKDEDGQWTGDTNIKTSWFPEEGFPLVALAGVLAEAKAMASENANVQQLAMIAGLATTIHGIFTNQFLDLDDDGPWPVDVPIVASPPESANITREDLELIP